MAELGRTDWGPPASAGRAAIAAVAGVAVVALVSVVADAAIGEAFEAVFKQ